LIVALLSVWGFIAFKMIFNFEKKEEIIISSFKVKIETKAIKKDSFHIKANYKDPFRIRRLLKIKNKKKTRIKATTPKKQKSIKPKTTKKIDISHIKYYGTIKNKSTSKTVGILFINNQEIKIKKSKFLYFCRKL